MVSLLLIIFYSTVFIFWLLKISRSYRNYLSAQQVAISFIVKIAFGFAYGFLFLKFYKGDDTWQYHNFSLVEYQHLLQEPFAFFHDIRTKANGNASLSSIYDTTNSFWNKLDDVLFVKLLTLLNILSFGHYYVNVVLFCFLVYIGHFLLFRLLVDYFPKSSLLFIFSIFYIPMVTFWLSGIRKEGIIFLGLAMVLFHFDRLLRKQGFIIFHLVLFITGFALLLIMRNLVVMCLAPSLFAWFLCKRFRWNEPLTFATVYAAFILCFFLSSAIPVLPDLPAKVSQRQHDFLSLTANTRLPIDSLEGTATSFFKILPQAFNHSFFRPYITESKGILQVISAADIFLFYFILIAAILYRKDNWPQVIRHPVILTLIATALFAYLLIGYTVPFPGTFIRYKSVFELLFFCVFVACIDPEKIGFINISKK